MSAQQRPKSLVVFFSRTRTTRHLAEAIARAVHADVEELREGRSRRGFFGWLRSGYEATQRVSAQTLPLQHDLRGYDLIFVGTPTWNRALSSPVRWFLEQNRDVLSNVALFATCASQGGTEVLAEMAGLLPRPPLASLWMLEHDVKHGPAVWVGELTEAALSRLESQPDTSYSRAAAPSA